jgi:uncharacterized NAD(P)/FAD-binding protein YdhS
LVGGLLEAGLARTGPHGLGLDVDATGHLLDRSGTAQERLWLVGPLRRGVWWETTAVPELRAQAAAFVDELAPAGAAARRESRPIRLREPRQDAA